MLPTRLVSVALSALLLAAAVPAVLRLASADDAPKSPAPKADDTVAAKRYKTRVVVEGGRGGSTWIEELYFPEQGVCANVEWSLEPKGDTWDDVYLLNAFHGPMRNRFRMEMFDAEESESPAEDVRMPAALAKQIFEAADLTRRLNQQRRDAGSRASGLGLCRELDENGAVQVRRAPAAGK
jgi:hypothetical protein